MCITYRVSVLEPFVTEHHFLTLHSSHTLSDLIFLVGSIVMTEGWEYMLAKFYKKQLVRRS